MNAFDYLNFLSFSFRYYVMAIIIGPILFYIPRFFEIETVYKPLSVDDISDNCSSFRPSVPILPILEVPCVDGKCNVQIGWLWERLNDL